jgi:hypothetical protein
VGFQTGYGIALLPSPTRLSESGVSVVPIVHAGILVVDERGYGLHVEQLADHAAEIVKAQVDVINATGDLAIRAAQQATTTIPILRNDPAFKLACGRLPDTDRDLCSQPTLSRLENAPCLREAIRLSYALVEAT